LECISNIKLAIGELSFQWFLFGDRVFLRHHHDAKIVHLLCLIQVSTDAIFSYWEETHNPSHIEKIVMESPFLIQIPPTNQRYNNSLLSLGTHLLASINTMHMHRWFSAFLLPKSALPMRTPARTNSPSAMAQFRHYACCGKCILMHDSFHPSDTLYLL